jgi:DNA-directed RNA polymerase specialized sigma24 family protein
MKTTTSSIPASYRRSGTSKFESAHQNQLRRNGGRIPHLGGGGTSWTWEAIVQTHRAAISQLAIRLTATPEDAEDLVQDVFAQVFSYTAVQIPGTLEGWLLGMTALLYLENEVRSSRVCSDSGDFVSDLSFPGEYELKGSLEDRSLNPEVQSAFRALAPNLPASVVVCGVEGFSILDIATNLGVRGELRRSRIHPDQSRTRTGRTRQGRHSCEQSLVVEAGRNAL